MSTTKSLTEMDALTLKHPRVRYLAMSYQLDRNQAGTWKCFYHENKAREWLADRYFAGRALYTRSSNLEAVMILEVNFSLKEGIRSYLNAVKQVGG